MELIRRLVLFVGAVFLVHGFYYTPLPRLLQVGIANFEEEKTSAPFHFVTDEELRLRALPLESYIEEVTRGKLIVVVGAAWSELFEKLVALQKGQVSGDLAQRFSAEQENFSKKDVFFRLDEAPFYADPRISQMTEEFYVQVSVQVPGSFSGSSSGVMLRVRPQVYTDDDFLLGVGISGRWLPPASLFYPWRGVALMVFMGSLVLYVLIPWPKREPGELYYQRFRIVLSDFVAMIMLVMFSAVPIAVVGSTMTAFRVWYGFVGIMWCFAMVGSFLLLLAASFSAYSVRLSPEGLVLKHLYGIEKVRLDQIVEMSPAVHVSPKWLRVLTVIAAIFGGGRALGRLGPALIAAGAEAHGYSLILRSGTRINVWWSDSLGNPIISNHQRLIDGLENLGVKQSESGTHVEDSILVNPVVPPGRGNGSGAIKFLKAMLWVFGPSAVLVMFGFFGSL